MTADPKTYAIPEDRLARQRAMLSEGRAVQGAWHRRGGDGRELACLLGALGPEISSPEQCNGDWMPEWLAQLMPQLFDGVLPVGRAIELGLEWNATMTKARGLDDTAWGRIRSKFLAFVVLQAPAAARPSGEAPSYRAAVEKACLRVAELHEVGGTSRKFRAARAAAQSEAWSAQSAALAAADAAADAAARAAARARAYDRQFVTLIKLIEAER